MRLIRRQTLLRALIAVAMGFLSAESFAQQPVKPLSARPVSDGLSPRAGSVDPLLQQLDQAISVTSSRFLTADGPTPHSPWQIFHGILALKQDFQLKLVEGGKIRAIDWIANAEPSFDNKPSSPSTASQPSSHVLRPTSPTSPTPPTPESAQRPPSRNM